MKIVVHHGMRVIAAIMQTSAARGTRAMTAILDEAGGRTIVALVMARTKVTVVGARTTAILVGRRRRVRPKREKKAATLAEPETTSRGASGALHQAVHGGATGRCGRN